MNITLARAQVCGAQKRPFVWALVFQKFYYEAFAEPLQILNKEFRLETEFAIDKLLNFQVDV
jgi:hypothetical protein